MKHHNSYKYDSKGNKIEEIEKSEYDSDKENSSLGDKKTYKYDSKGHIIEYKEYYFSETATSKLTYAYDSKGNKIQETYYDKDGEIETKYLYTFDTNGNKIEKHYDYDGDLTTSKYDTNGNIAEKAYYSFDEENKEQIFLYRTIYTFDSRGNKLEEADYEDGVKTITYTCTYDSKGNKLEEADYEDGNKTMIYTCAYDSKGNKLEEVEYNDDGEIYEKKSFKYDSKGNWTSKMFEENTQRWGKETKVHERKISYHE